MPFVPSRLRQLIPTLAVAVLLLALLAAVLTPLAAAPAGQAGSRTSRVPDPHLAGVQYFAATGHTLRGPFLSYWNRFGGLAQFGYPITEEFSEVNDGKPQVVQYFERARFEHHPENAGTAYEVLLGALGQAFHKPDPAVPAQANPSSRYFDATGHNLGGAFRLYWEAHGSLFVNGYPISEAFQETNPIDGKVYTVQYFERSRFELHPENAGTQYEVLLGLLGAQLAQQKGYFSNNAGTAPGSYPAYGHAPDFAWIAGQVAVTRIQGSCVYVQYDAADVGARIVPIGEAWTNAQAAEQVPDGALVVVFGHLAQPGEPVPVCPGGRGYVVDNIQANPAAPTH